MATTLAVLQALAALVGFFSQLLKWKQSADDRQAGRDEVASKTNAQTVETQDAMDGVARPSDDDVTGSLQSGKF